MDNSYHNPDPSLSFVEPSFLSSLSPLSMGTYLRNHCSTRSSSSFRLHRRCFKMCRFLQAQQPNDNQGDTNQHLSVQRQFWYEGAVRIGRQTTFQEKGHHTHEDGTDAMAKAPHSADAHSLIPSFADAPGQESSQVVGACVCIYMYIYICVVCVYTREQTKHIGFRFRLNNTYLSLHEETPQGRPPRWWKTPPQANRQQGPCPSS